MARSAMGYTIPHHLVVRGIVLILEDQVSEAALSFVIIGSQSCAIITNPCNIS